MCFLQSLQAPGHSQGLDGQTQHIAVIVAAALQGGVDRVVQGEPATGKRIRALAL